MGDVGRKMIEEVFPARAGMNRGHDPARVRAGCVPRASGDEPAR